jgi:hypothetical protein
MLTPIAYGLAIVLSFFIMLELTIRAITQLPRGGRPGQW